MCPGVRLEGRVVLVVCPSFCGVECKGHVWYPAFPSSTQFLLLALQKGQLGFFFFFFFVSFGPEFAPTAHTHSYF